MLTGDFIKDFEYLSNRIFIDKINTAFPRYNEWEYGLISWRDFCWAWWLWKTDHKKQLLKNDLIEAIKFFDKDFIYWIASRQHLRANIFYKVNVRSKQRTFATIWVNANWKRFKPIIENIKEKVILVANKVWEWKKYPFKVDKFYWVPFDAVWYYEDNKEHILKMCNDIAKHKNKLILFCAWPLSNIMIYECFKINPNNRYVDIGSCLDLYIHWAPSRQYYNINWKTYNQIDYL